MCTPTPTMPALGRQWQVGVCECSYVWEYDLFQCGCPGGKHLPFASYCLHSASSVSRGRVLVERKWQMWAGKAAWDCGWTARWPGDLGNIGRGKEVCLFSRGGF